MAFDTKIIGDRVKALRKEAGLNQKDLAAAAGLHPNTVLNLEKGTLKAVEISTLKQLSDALDVPFGILLLGDGAGT